jgi:hypothetical protein
MAERNDAVDLVAAREELLTRLLVERFGTPPRRRPARRPVAVATTPDPTTRGRGR